MFIKPKLPLWLPWNMPLIRHPDGIRLLRAPSGALANECCCNVENDCTKFRGISGPSFIHDHYDYVKVRFPAWGNATPWIGVGESSVSNECCDQLDGDYELPINDYTDNDWFGLSPGMWFPNCMPCHDCDTEPVGATWASLAAYCNECAVPPGDAVFPCRPWSGPDGVDPEDIDIIWTVELIVWGYFGPTCGAPHLCDFSNPKMVAIWAKTALPADAPHNYAGAHLLTLREHYGETPGAGTDEEKYYCQPPDEITLYAGVEPPAP